MIVRYCHFSFLLVLFQYEKKCLNLSFNRKFHQDFLLNKNLSPLLINSKRRKIKFRGTTLLRRIPVT
ncbi:hypothetical protein COPCOM_01773 [Coprococcus comes ATCC 27758]|uniref:Uncharacterized protein n=1 Tax=Coprococcus comes ATCC 27758 TaxID=470146 RepID=C0B9E8_9FIRM|nr:hypothetical protein COPCOM_01773 [Coprococcus comes ATCC 27758]